MMLLSHQVFAQHIDQQPQSIQKCEGESASFSLTLNTMANTYTYQWQYSSDNMNWVAMNPAPAILNDGNTHTMTIPEIENSDEGYYRVLVTEDMQTQTSNAAFLTVLPAPVLNPITPANPILNCSILSVSLSTPNPPAGATLTWTLPNGATTSDMPLTASLPGLYSLTATNQNMCSTTVSTFVSQNNTGGPTATVTSTSTKITCTETTITLLASNLQNVDSYEWCDNSGNCTPNILSLVVSSAGTYTFKVTKGSCMQSYPITITSDNSIPIISFTPAAPFICKEGSSNVTAVVSGGGTFNYIWSNGTNTSNNTIDAAEDYTVTVTNSINGCSAVNTVNVKEVIPVFNLPFDTMVDITEDVLLTINPDIDPAGGFMSWQIVEMANLSQIIGDTSSHFGAISNRYFIEDERSLGGIKYLLTPRFGSCTGEPLVFTVTVTSNSDTPFIPEIYTPNGDGQNDVWQIAMPDGVDMGEYTIFNRLGGKVYAGDTLNPWDGSACPDGAYFYVLRYTQDGEEKVLKGAVTILRATD